MFLAALEIDIQTEFVGRYTVRIRGPFACFTRPEFKAERVSYEVLTPSAARGILEAILWKPALYWHIRRIRLLAPIRFIQFKRNEITRTAKLNVAEASLPCAELPDYFANEDRAQRNTLALRDVDYAVDAEMNLTSRAGAEDNSKKFDQMFRRRLEHGQVHMQPYLGCREFPATVEPYIGDPPTLQNESRDLGLMLHDIRYTNACNIAVFFKAQLKKGVVHVPVWKIL